MSLQAMQEQLRLKLWAFRWKCVARRLRVNLSCANANWEHCLVAIRERDDKLARLEETVRLVREAITGSITWNEVGEKLEALLGVVKASDWEHP